MLAVVGRPQAVGPDRAQLADAPALELERPVVAVAQDLDLARHEVDRRGLGVRALRPAVERRQDAVEQRSADDGRDDERAHERGVPDDADPATARRGAPAAGLGLDLRRRPRPQVARRDGLLEPERAEREPLLAVLGRDGAARAAPGQVVVQPMRVIRLDRAVEPLAASSRARSWSAANGSRRRRGLTIARPIGGRGRRRASRRRAPRRGLRRPARPCARPPAPGAGSRAPGSAARGRRRGTRPARRRARGPVRSWSSASSSADRWRSGIRSSARWSSPDRRASITRCSADGAVLRALADERDEPDDAAAAQVVERDAVGDLVQPRPGVLGLLERVVARGTP